jgi:hypothetical protein
MPELAQDARRVPARGGVDQNIINQVNVDGVERPAAEQAHPRRNFMHVALLFPLHLAIQGPVTSARRVVKQNAAAKSSAWR